MPDKNLEQPSSISCVVPCFNEAANLGVLVPGLVSALSLLAPAFEIIIVDDGSTDSTPELLEALANRHPQVVYVQLSRNFGKEAALSAGLEAARGHVVVTLDADLQHPPALIAPMLERWRQGVDMVYAVRSTRQEESLFKRLGTKCFYRLMRTSGGITVPENAGDFRLMDRKVVDALLLLPERNRFMKGLFAWVGFKTEPFDYTPPQRLYGATSFKPFTLFHFALDGLTAFTTWPLRLLSMAGILLSLISFSYGLFIIIKYFMFGDPVQGWVSLITVVLFFAGINLISIGVLGEYIARIFGEVKNRPLYLVRNQKGQGLGQRISLSQPEFLAGDQRRQSVSRVSNL